MIPGASIRPAWKTAPSCPLQSTGRPAISLQTISVIGAHARAGPSPPPHPAGESGLRERKRARARQTLLRPHDWLSPALHLCMPLQVTHAERAGSWGAESSQGSMAAGQGDAEALEEGKPPASAGSSCAFWLPRKKRTCSGRPVAGSKFCGNHLPAAAAQRVPCPLDPSHTVAVSALAAHLERCPAAKLEREASGQPYFCRGVNAGGEETEAGGGATAAGGRREGERLPPLRAAKRGRPGGAARAEGEGAGPAASGEAHPPGPQGPPLDQSGTGAANSHPEGPPCVDAEPGRKRAAVLRLGKEELAEFVRRVEGAFAAVCAEAALPERVLRPRECSAWLEGERSRETPFSEKHALQQASMLGNMAAAGLLPSPSHGAAQGPVYVEFGAGRGYLSQMMCDCYRVEDFVLVDRRSYKFKADRTLRKASQVHVERLRIDIADLDLAGVSALRGRKFVAVSKHLCGAATDVTLRCCLASMKPPKAGTGPSALRPAGSQSGSPGGSLPGPRLAGLAIATCCHHLCTWSTYVNKRLFHALGFSQAEFEMITWLTSWAVSGETSNQVEHVDSSEASTKERSAGDSRMKPVAAGDCDGHLDQENHQCLAADNNQDNVVLLQKVCAGGVSPADQEAENPAGFNALRYLEHSERAVLGRKCKLLLDMGRLHWLRENGMEATMNVYIPSSISPENKLLLATLP